MSRFRLGIVRFHGARLHCILLQIIVHQMAGIGSRSRANLTLREANRALFITLHRLTIRLMNFRDIDFHPRV